jgi:competence protein ComEA
VADQPSETSPRSTALLVAAVLGGLGLLAVSRPLWSPTPPEGAALDEAIDGLVAVDPLLVGQPLGINTAGVSELDTLPGIGPALAERIVAERELHGPYRDPADLARRVVGVGDELAGELAGYVRF